MATSVTLDTIVALCKRRGFVFPSAEIYGGLNGVYDFGPLGTLLRKNLKDAWLNDLLASPYEVVLLDGSILGSEKVWEASGHLENFTDPMIDCLNCKKRFRPDDDNIDINRPCPSCGVKNWTDVRLFHMMFKTELGAMAERAAIAYLRPETAQSIFINFKNVMSSCRVRVPFGIAQIGKAFRNEITPKQFLFRMREFEQMEMEFFTRPEDAARFFDEWIAIREKFYAKIGIRKEAIRIRPHAKEELSHYSRGTVDVEYQFPFGWKELEGIANRGDFDLSRHSEFSGKDLAIFDEATKTSYVPHVVETSVGVDRLFLVTLFDAYREDMIEGETRVYLAFHPRIAPVKAAVLPLMKALVEPAEKLYAVLKKAGISTQFDATGSIGKRYRRQDEIGTPFCITYDYQSVEDNTVTVRYRDSCKQERINCDQVVAWIMQHLDMPE